MAVIYEDTLQQRHGGVDKHRLKHEWWNAHGIEVVRTRFDGKHDVPWSFGDYWAEGANVVVDSKASIAEVASNLGREHDRFRREIARANQDGCMLVVLVETADAEDVNGIETWLNVHCVKCRYMGKPCNPRDRDEVCVKHGTKKPLHGDTLAKQMRTMEMTRSVRFEFAVPEESARRICELLGVSYATDQSN